MIPYPTDMRFTRKVLLFNLTLKD